MKLASAFVRLPLRFDVERLAQEVRALPAEAWARHPTDYAGNSAARLISLNGEENDEMTGGWMQPTPHLQQSPYIQQVLASFGTVWTRSRLMKLAPGAQVPQHVDINYHWFRRVRVHIPVLTYPEVRFYCGDQSVHMAAGEAWIFDNWRSHRVENASAFERVHLVADTSGSSHFWRLVSLAGRGQPDQFLPYQAGRASSLRTERVNTYRVMPPAEIDQLLLDLAEETAATGDHPDAENAILRFRALLEAFCHDWRQLWSVHGDSDAGIPQFLRMVEAMREQGGNLAKQLVVHSNRRPIMEVLNARLMYSIDTAQRSLGAAATAVESNSQIGARAPRPQFDRPIFIVAAPRSGSTLLYETLECSPQLWTLGGEAHWLVEGIPQLRPGAQGVDSNRLGVEHVTAELRDSIPARIAQKLQDVAGRPWTPDDAARVRFLEKTPKNALRIPFFSSIFPDALFVFLWRDPRENLSSIIEAWRSRRWITYPALPDWDGPWSLLLPPEWRSLRGKPLPEIALHQWASTNTLIMNDLQALSPQRRLVVRYDDLLANPAAVVSGICRFADLALDTALQQRSVAALPYSRHTLTAPQPEKWRANAGLIEPLAAQYQTVWQRLQDFR